MDFKLDMNLILILIQLQQMDQQLMNKILNANQDIYFKMEINALKALLVVKLINNKENIVQIVKLIFFCLMDLALKQLKDVLNKMKLNVKNVIVENITIKMDYVMIILEIVNNNLLINVNNVFQVWYQVVIKIVFKKQLIVQIKLMIFAIFVQQALNLKILYVLKL